MPKQINKIISTKKICKNKVMNLDTKPVIKNGHLTYKEHSLKYETYFGLDIILWSIATMD